MVVHANRLPASMPLMLLRKFSIQYERALVLQSIARLSHTALRRGPCCHRFDDTAGLLRQPLTGAATCFGRQHECRLDSSNSLRHLTFEFPAGFRHPLDLAVPAFLLSRFKAIRSIGHAVQHNGIQQLFIEVLAKSSATMPLKVNQRLKRLQRLQGTLEADRARLDVVPECGLSHDRPDQVVCQDVRPDFFANQLGCLASQDVHLHRGLDRAQIEFVIPAGTIQQCQILLRRLLGIQQGRHHDEGLRPESGCT